MHHSHVLAQVRNAIRHPRTSLGGYPVYVVLVDGDLLCCECARDCYRLISYATRQRLGDGWQALGAEIYWEGPDMWCAQCGALLESAYGEAEDGDC